MGSEAVVDTIPELEPGSAPVEAYRAFISEMDRLGRLSYDQRDASAVLDMTTPAWAPIVEEFLFEEPEYVNQSDRDSEVAVEVISLSETRAELSVCRSTWNDLLYVESGDQIGGGRQRDTGFLVTMVELDGSWLVDSELFDQSHCDS